MSLQANISRTNEKNDNYVVQKRFDIKNGKYGVWETKGDNSFFIEKGSAVYVDFNIINISTKEHYLKIYFFDAQGNRVDIVLPRKDLTDQGILGLLAYGVQVTKQDAKALIMSIINQEPEVSCILQHDSLGFSTFDNKTVFLADKAIGVESQYNGKLQIGTKGKYSLWKKMIQKEVIGNIALEFILAVGGSGVFVDYLREKIQVDNVIISMVSESSQGKTTAGLLMVSCGANPSFQGDSTALNFSDTQNALLSTIRSSYPFLIDEGSLCRYNPTNLLYSLAMGKEKNRLNKDYAKAEGVTFNTAIAITSEKSLLDMSDDNTGLLVRVMEISNISWTKSAQNSDNIKSIIKENYGWLVPKLAKKIISIVNKNDQDSIVTQYREWQSRFIDDAVEQGSYSGLTERVSKQCALIMLSASFIQDVMNIEMHLDDIVDFIEEYCIVKDISQANIGERALTYLMQYYTLNYTQFIGPDDDYVPQKCYGRIKKGKKIILKNGLESDKRLLISENQLQIILNEGSFPDKKVILKKWKEIGYLRSEKDRYISDVKIIDDVAVKGYIINMPCKKD